ncbi:MAG: hypothetical protein ACN6P2_22540 [Pseudomonas palmensis]|uniref:hypothetical protein n=1 Tax=Pseudomonas palmensis TaxID=2815362 RepID=UPI003D12FCE1
MDQATLTTLLTKLRNCDLEGAAADLQAQAVALAARGEEALSDFLARYAFRSLQGKHSPDKTSPALAQALHDSEQHLQQLHNERKALLDDIHTYFLEFEKIAVNLTPALIEPATFSEQNRDNLPFIEDYLSGRREVVDDLNLQSVLKKQIKFYLNLNLHDERPTLQVSYRKTHIQPGKSWRFVELSQQAGQRSEQLNRLVQLDTECDAVQRQVSRLKWELRCNEDTGNQQVADFQKKLGLYMASVAAQA